VSSLTSPVKRYGDVEEPVDEVGRASSGAQLHHDEQRRQQQEEQRRQQQEQQRQQQEEQRASGYWNWGTGRHGENVPTQPRDSGWFGDEQRRQQEEQRRQQQEQQRQQQEEQRRQQQEQQRRG
jgi:colicin import membrane protein